MATLIDDRRLRNRAMVALAIVVTLAGAASAELIDRVMAIVAGRVITLSEVNAARDLGLIDVTGAADPLGAAVDRLVERELVLSEVERYAPPEPTAAAIEGRLALIRARFKTADDFAAALTRAGYSEPRLREIIRDDLRIENYLAQRFTAAAEPNDVDIERYYREHEAEFKTGGALPPMSKIREAIRQKLAAGRRRTLIADWIAGLRRRNEVTVLHLPTSGK